MNSFAATQATLNLFHVTIRDPDIDLTETCGIKCWFLPNEPHSKATSRIVWLAAGASGTLPSAFTEEEVYVSVENGEIELFVDNRWLRLTAGQSLSVPDGNQPALRNSSKVSCLLFYCVSPRPFQ